MVARLTFTDCVVRLHEGAIRAPQNVLFLQALRRHLERSLLVVWDVLRVHRSRRVAETTLIRP